MARKSKKNQIVFTPEAAKVQIEEYNKLKTVTFDNGQWTEIYPKFRDTRIDEMLDSLFTFLAEFEKNRGYFPTDKQLHNFVFIFIIIYFSTACPEIPKDFESKVTFLNEILDSKLMDLDRHFDGSQIARVYEIMLKKFEQYKNMIEQNEQLRKQLFTKVESMNLPHWDTIKSVMFGVEGSGNIQ